MNAKRVVVERSIYVVLFLTYIGLAFLFSSFSPQAQVVSLWPPAGVALAGCLILGHRFLAAIFLGSLIFNTGIQCWHQGSFSTHFALQGAVIGLGSMLQAWINYRLLRALSLDVLDAPSLGHTALFMLSALLCCLISAVVGNVALALTAEPIASVIEWHNVLVWWMGDFFGVILVMPLILCLFYRRVERQLPNVSRGNTVIHIALPLCLVVVIFQVAQQYIENDIVISTRERFELHAKVAENSLKQQVEAYTDALDGLEAVLLSTPNISYEQFTQLVEQLTVGLPGIRAMSWNPLVESQQRHLFEQAARRKIDPDFRLKGEPLLASDPLVVVEMISPLEGNKAALGFNVFSSPARKEAMIRACNTMSAMTTDVIQLVQSDKSEPGFLIFQPVYQGVRPSEGGIGVERSLSGFVVGVFLVAEIIEQGLNHELNGAIEVYVSDGDKFGQKIYGDERIIDDMTGEEGLSYAFVLTLINKQWHIALHIAPEVVKKLQVSDSLNFLMAEALLGSFVVFIILSSYGRHEQLCREVKARTCELETANAELEHYAFRDSLTGLPNRRLFIERVNHALCLAERNGYQLALIFMDLNRFKQVNDSLGHQYGDQLLIEVAKRFRAALRSSDTLARFGGDEFTVMMENNPDTDVIMAVARKLIDCLRQPIELAKESVITSTSIGIAVYPQDGHSIIDLLRGADSAMYQAKESTDDICFYSEGLRDRASHQLFLESELPQVLEKQQLELYYQPIMQFNPLCQMGCECLLRWNHPEQGLISPDRFIPVAERSGQIVPIGYWVLDQTCRKIARWQGLGFEFCKVSVNVSARQLQSERFIDDVGKLLQQHAIAPEIVQLEITESVLMEDINKAVASLRELKSLGVTLAIDDYGTGYSSLSYLKKMPVDVLKIDQSFVREMHHGGHDHAIVRSTIKLAADLGIMVVAEGVETEEQHSILKQMNCSMGQGYLFSKPLPEGEFLAQARRLRCDTGITGKGD